jgi:hypothetical protein
VIQNIKQFSVDPLKEVPHARDAQQPVGLIPAINLSNFDVQAQSLDIIR